MKLLKSKQSRDAISPIKTKQDDKRKSYVVRQTIRALGLLILGFSASLYIEGLPIVFVFLTGYVGVRLDAKLSTVGSGLWLLSCIGVMLPLLYVFLAWIRFVWHRFLVHPESVKLFSSRHQ